MWLLLGAHGEEMDFLKAMVVYIRKYIRKYRF